jgi:hypothetical protein
MPRELVVARILGPVDDRRLDLGRHRRLRPTQQPGAAGLPLAREAVTRIDAVFDAERAINGLDPGARLAVRKPRLPSWSPSSRPGCAASGQALPPCPGKAMDYMLKRRDGFARFLADGRVCLTNNPAERGLRGIVLGRKARLFAGSTAAARGPPSCTA